MTCLHHSITSDSSSSWRPYCRDCGGVFKLVPLKDPEQPSVEPCDGCLCHRWGKKEHCAVCKPQPKPKCDHPKDWRGPCCDSPKPKCDCENALIVYMEKGKKKILDYCPCECHALPKETGGLDTEIILGKGERFEAELTEEGLSIRFSKTVL